MAWTFCTSGSAILKAGANANSTITASGSALQIWSEEAEDTICNIARVDLITNYDSLTTNGKKILGSLCSAMIAQNIVSYDLSAYGSLRNAETILDVLENSIFKNTNLIKDDNVKTYLEAT